MPAQETEWEKLIRTGQMTPFGTKTPQKQEKPARRIMLNEASDFEKYLADQAKLSMERKRSANRKGAKQKVCSEKNHTQTVVSRVKGNKSKSESKLSSRLKKRMKKLQHHVLQIQSKARIPKAKEIQNREQQEESDESECVPDEEILDLDKEEDFCHDAGGSKVKYLPERDKSSLMRTYKGKEADDDFFPSSEEDKNIGKSKIKRCRDDGNEDYYKQRLRLVYK